MDTEKEPLQTDNLLALPPALIAAIASWWLKEGRLEQVAEVLRLKAGDINSNLHLAETAVRLEFQRGDIPRARERFLQLCQHWPLAEISDDLLLLEARCLYAEKGVRATLDFFQLAGEERSHEVLYYRGRLHIFARHWESAIEDLERALRRAPQEDMARISLALAVAEAHGGMPASGFRRMRAYLPHVPPSRRWYMRASMIAIEAGEAGMAYSWARLAAMHGMTGAKLAAVRARSALDARPALAAVQEILQLVKAEPHRSELHHLLALAYFKNSDPKSAMEAVAEGIHLAPEILEHWILKADLLRVAGDAQGALECLLEAKAVARQSGGWVRAVALLPLEAPPTADGEARRGASELEPRIASLREVLADEPAMIPAIEGRAFPEVFRPSWTPEDIRYRLSPVEAIRSYFRVFLALILRDIRTRYSRNRVGYLWAVAEPAAQVAVFVGIFTLLGGNRDLLGMSIPLFLVTGILPFLLFQQTFSRISGCIRTDRALLSHPHVRPMDIVVARAALELMTVVCVMTLFLAVLGLFGDDVVPENFPRLAAALALLWGAGLGLGLTVEALTPFFRSIATVASATIRILYFTSGALFSVSMLPRGILDYVLLNPLVHAVEIARQSFTPFLHTPGVNFVYPSLAVGWLVLFGLLANRAMEKRLLED